MISKKLLDRVRIDQKFNDEISPQTADKIEECNCDTCAHFITSEFFGAEIQSCKFPGIKTKYELESGNRIFVVCEKYKQKEK